MRDIVAGLMQVAGISRSTAAWTVHDAGDLEAAAESALTAEIARSGATIAVAALPRILGDGEQLQELLVCLLSNAIKFARPDHPPHIRVAAERVAEGWRFTVADDGMGVEGQYLEQIFQPFQRLKTGGDYPGVGLGLAISQRIVERHGGRIWADSTPGQGTTISFLLPPLAP
jgi:signal transduction histidine kinase